jgi:hypothetical protein
LGNLFALRDEFLPIELAGKLKMPAWLPAFPWYYWTIVVLVLIVVAVLEGAYREHISLTAKIEELGAGLNALHEELRILQILFDERDSRCVRDEPDLYGRIRVRRWYAGVHNASRRTSIDGVTLRAHDSQFVQCTIGVAHLEPGGSVKSPIVSKIETLPPGAEEFSELFGVGGSDVYSEHDILSKKQTFTLEARGRDAEKCLATLEYDPSTKPATIRRLS